MVKVRHLEFPFWNWEVKENVCAITFSADVVCVALVLQNVLYKQCLIYIHFMVFS